MTRKTTVVDIDEMIATLPSDEQVLVKRLRALLYQAAMVDEQFAKEKKKR